MFVFFMILALVFLIAGGAGLFYTNTTLIIGNPNWVQGNITFGTFTVVGLATLIFLALFGSEIE